MNQSEPVCIYCGTPRAAAIATCPKCGRGWIDQQPPTPTEAASVDAVEQYMASELPAIPERRWVPILVTLIGAAAVVAIVWFGLDILREEGPDAATSVAPSTSSTEAATTTTSNDVAPTTTTTVGDTTTVTTASLELPSPSGQPLTVADLPMGAFALGPLEIGAEADSVIGRMITSFGEPDEYEEITGADGLCPGTTGRRAVWGPLTIVTQDDEFAAYRLVDGFEHELSSLRTLSGLTVGDPATDVETIYTGFAVGVDADRYSVRRPSDGLLLIWGTLDETRVTGVFSPNACDGETD